MNFFRKYTILFLLSGLFFSCDSLFDQELPPHKLMGENAITDETSAETALNGIYSYLDDFGIWDSYYIVDNNIRLGFLEGVWRNAFENQLRKLEVEESVLDLKTSWVSCAKLVNSANNFIYYVERLSDSKFGKERKTEMLAEAKFLRAFGQLRLMKMFGHFWDINSQYGPLMRRDPSSLSNNQMPRSNVQDAYRMILEDLDFATTSASEFKSVFRICRTAAKAFKTEVLMMRGEGQDYENAIVLIDEILKSPEFGMEDSFKDVFERGYSSKELLFSRHLSSTHLNQAEGNIGSMVKMFGGTFIPSDSYYSILGKEDARYKYTFDSLFYKPVNSSKKSLIWKKLWKSDKNTPMYYMRLAQMHLFKAEAMIYTGATTQNVIDELNILRLRSGNTLLNAANYQDRDRLMDIVFDEWVREIGMENGSEYFVAVRMIKSGGSRKIHEYNLNYEKDIQLALPIPLGELENNMLMKQNPIYIRK